MTRNTIACPNGDKMGFELVSPDAWAERVAEGRYELVKTDTAEKGPE